ncbi:MAG TPA: hypothetical protein VGL29_21280 [Blastocatellia bacterium]
MVWRRKTTKYLMRPVISTLLFLAVLAISANSSARFERTYSPRGPAHLSISNVNGSIHVVGWDRRTIVARADASPSITIEDQALGDDITIWTRRNLSLGHANFEVSLPPETSLAIKNVIGKIELQNITGHVSVNSFDSDVHLVGIDSPSVDVRVTSGDIFFDGLLHEGGSYNLQSMRGDLDVTLPSASPFNLNARALSENINLGSFLSNLTGSSRGPKGVSGTYLRGGPRLTLTAYAGRILLHKK